MEPQKKFSSGFIFTMLFFATLFIILMMNLDNIAQVKRTPEEIKRCQKKYLDFSFKGKYIDLVGISGAAMYLEIEPEEINGYDKCFFPSFKKKNEKLYYRGCLKRGSFFYKKTGEFLPPFLKILYL